VTAGWWSGTSGCKRPPPAGSATCSVLGLERVASRPFPVRARGAGSPREPPSSVIRPAWPAAAGEGDGARAVRSGVWCSILKGGRRGRAGGGRVWAVPSGRAGGARRARVGGRGRRPPPGHAGPSGGAGAREGRERRARGGRAGSGGAAARRAAPAPRPSACGPGRAGESQHSEPARVRQRRRTAHASFEQ
jgi:hypothetical protein